MKKTDEYIYILYASGDDKVKAVVDNIREYIEDKLDGVKAFDYQDREAMRKEDENPQHHRMSTLIEAIANGKIVINIDDKYLKSFYCLAEIYAISIKSDKDFIKDNVTCIIHDENLYKNLYKKTKIEEVLDSSRRIE